LFNDGTGHFVETAHSQLPDSTWPTQQGAALGVRSLDVNGDGFQDLFVVMDDNAAGQTITDGTSDYYLQILINDGAGGFVYETATRWHRRCVAKSVTSTSLTSTMMARWTSCSRPAMRRVSS